jgi:hypothetical protein
MKPHASISCLEVQATRPAAVSWIGGARFDLALKGRVDNRLDPASGPRTFEEVQT